MESLYQIALIKTHAVVLVCEAARDQFVSRSIIPEKLATVVYNGIEPTLSPIKLSITNNQRRVELGLPETGIILGSIGRLNKVKDYETLIRAFSLLTESIREVSLVIVGDGPERQKLQNLIDELELGQRVKLIGERNDIDSLLEQFSVFALTSKTEGLSVALIEAAWAGLPIVATDVGGNREIVDDGITGYLVQVGAAAETSEKISILIRNEQFRNKASKLIREKAEIKWSLHAMEKRYEDIYQKIFP
jgi:glycosyltransferase involved in cell wall biosynthesis